MTDKKKEIGDMELSKAIDDIIDQLGLLAKGKSEDMKEEKEAEDEKKSKGKSEAYEGKETEAEEKKEEEAEKKAKGKSEDEEKKEEESEGEEKAYYSKKSMTLTKEGEALLIKAIAAKKEADAAELAKSKTADNNGEVDFKKSVMSAIGRLQDAVQDLSKRPARVRKSIANEYEAIEKSKAEQKEVKITAGEITDTMLEMVQKGQISSNAVCEFNATNNILDPLVKSQVLSAVKAKKGLK